MTTPLERVRQESPEKRKLIAFVVAGGIVAVIFVVWITGLISSFGKESNAVVAEEEYKPSFVESTKRKAKLLFGNLEFPQVGSSIEYDSDNYKSVAAERGQSLEERTGIATTTDQESFEELFEALFEEEKPPIE